MHFKLGFVFWTQPSQQCWWICFGLFSDFFFVNFSSDSDPLGSGFRSLALFVSSQNHVDHIPLQHKYNEYIQRLKHIHYICEVPIKLLQSRCHHWILFTKSYNIAQLIWYYVRISYQFDFDVELAASPEIISNVHITPKPRKSLV